MSIKKAWYFILGVFDEVKDFLFAALIRIGIVLLIFIIIHNFLKITEISMVYSGQYKNLVRISNENESMMNLYITGDGPKTIVILPGYGSQSPVIQYKALAEELKANYKVVIVEYLGYGYSMKSNTERTNENITKEIMEVLKSAKLDGPYVLMPHSHSSIYAMYFQQKYPNLVDAIVSIDGTYPAEIKDSYYEQKYNDDIANIRMSAVFEFTGFQRVMSYVNEKAFYIDKMKEMKNVYGKDEISVFRNRIGSSYLTKTMLDEGKMIIKNMREMSEYQYPSTLPVLQIAATETILEYDNAIKNENAKHNLKEYMEGVITNPSIQKIEKIDGDHMLHLTKTKELGALIKAYLISNYIY